MSEKTIRCVRCRAEFTDDDVKGHNACPKCGTKGVPMAIADDVQISINWHELRILGIWAERWAADCDREGEGDPLLPVVHAIVKCLQEQHPGRTALTLGGELAGLKRSGIKVEGPLPDGPVTPLKN